MAFTHYDLWHGTAANRSPHKIDQSRGSAAPRTTPPRPGTTFSPPSSVPRDLARFRSTRVPARFQRLHARHTRRRGVARGASDGSQRRKRGVSLPVAAERRSLPEATRSTPRHGASPARPRRGEVGASRRARRRCTTVIRVDVNNSHHRANRRRPPSRATVRRRLERAGESYAATPARSVIGRVGAHPPINRCRRRRRRRRHRPRRRRLRRRRRRRNGRIIAAKAQPNSADNGARPPAGVPRIHFGVVLGGTSGAVDERDDRAQRLVVGF